MNNKDFSYIYIEDMLKYYNNYKKKIAYFKLRLENIERMVFKANNGYDKLSVQSTCFYKDRLEKIEDIKEWLENKIVIYEFIVLKIEQALNVIKNDKYYIIIKMIFIECKSQIKVAKILGLSVGKVNQEKKRLIDIMKNIRV